MSNFTTIKSRCQKDENNHKIWVRFYSRPAFERKRETMRESFSYWTETEWSEYDAFIEKILSTPWLKRKPLILLHAIAVGGKHTSQHNTLSSLSPSLSSSSSISDGLYLHLSIRCLCVSFFLSFARNHFAAACPIFYPFILLLTTHLWCASEWVCDKWVLIDFREADLNSPAV